MRVFDFSYVVLSEAGFSIFLPILCKSWVTDIDLTDTGINAQAMLDLVVEFLQVEEFNLRSLRIGDNTMTDGDGLTAWARATSSLILGCRNLTRFAGAGVRATAKGTNMILRALDWMEISLLELDINKFFMGSPLDDGKCFGGRRERWLPIF